jgi:hypothetical protein
MASRCSAAMLAQLGSESHDPLRDQSADRPNNRHTLSDIERASSGIPLLSQAIGVHSVVNRHNLLLRDPNSLDHPLVQVVRHGHEAADQRGEKSPDSVSPQIEPVRVGLLATVLAVDDGGDTG